MGLGTLINALGVLAGGFVGMLIGHRISKNMLVISETLLYISEK